MAAETIKQLTFNREAYRDVLEVADELTAAENKYFEQIGASKTNPHDSIARLIREAGKAKIASLKEITTQKNSQSQVKKLTINNARG